MGPPCSANHWGLATSEDEDEVLPAPVTPPSLPLPLLEPESPPKAAVGRQRRPLMNSPKYFRVRASAARKCGPLLSAPAPGKGAGHSARGDATLRRAESAAPSATVSECVLVD